MMRSVGRYGSEEWIFPQIAQKILIAFHRKILRKIYGPVLVNGQWRKRCNYEMYRLYEEMELTRNIRLRILQWVSRVIRMQDERVAKKALKGYREGRRQVGRPRGRW